MCAHTCTHQHWRAHIHTQAKLPAIPTALPARQAAAAALQTCNLLLQVNPVPQLQATWHHKREQLQLVADCPGCRLLVVCKQWWFGEQHTNPLVTPDNQGAGFSKALLLLNPSAQPPQGLPGADSGFTKPSQRDAGVSSLLGKLLGHGIEC